MSKKKTHNNGVKSSTLYIDGMHCASCEVLIEKELLKQDGIESVDASLKGKKVNINYIGNNKPNTEQLNNEFKELGYRFSNKKFKKKNSPAFRFENGSLIINPQKVRTILKSTLVVALLIVIFFVFENLQLGQYISVDASSSLPAFFLLGIVAGLSSCAALVGGLLLSMIKQWNELYIDRDSKVQKAQPHIMFHIGRIISFTILGGVLGLIGETISFNNATFFAILTIIISFVMLLLALQMLEVKWAQNFKFTAPKSVTRLAVDENNLKGKYMPFGIGVLTFILPCGFTLIAQAVALSSGSFIQGALIMLLFALGTLPTLIAISYSGLKFNSKPHLTAKFNVIAGLIIVFFVVYNINGQLNVLGYPSLSDISFAKDNSQDEQIVDVDTEGIQTLNITAKGFEYIPTSSMNIKAGVPTTLVVDNQGIQGCAVYMAANGLIDNYVALKPGINEIDLGIPKKGTYKLTCSMGMVSPVTIKVI
jgi:sulfite exporter TauE/SafE/copper chaperone CopZ